MSRLITCQWKIDEVFSKLRHAIIGNVTRRVTSGWQYSTQYLYVHQRAAAMLRHAGKRAETLAVDKTHSDRVPGEIPYPRPRVRGPYWKADKRYCIENQAPRPKASKTRRLRCCHWLWRWLAHESRPQHRKLKNKVQRCSTTPHLHTAKSKPVVSTYMLVIFGGLNVWHN